MLWLFRPMVRHLTVVRRGRKTDKRARCVKNSKRGFFFIFNYHRRRGRRADKRRICFASNNGRRAVRNKSKRIEYLGVPVTKTQSARSSITVRTRFETSTTRVYRSFDERVSFIVWENVGTGWRGIVPRRFVIIRKRSNGFLPTSAPSPPIFKPRRRESLDRNSADVYARLNRLLFATENGRKR